MPTVKLYYVKLSVAFIACFTGLIYWLFWYSGMTRHVLISTWFQFKIQNSNTTCLGQLLSAFEVKELNPAAPTYARLPKPVPISDACSGLLVNFTSTPRLSASNFTKYENLSPAEQEKMHWYVQQLFVNFTQRNLELFLAGDSLLGSVRHHGFFPWDADADVMIPRSQKSSAIKLLIDLSASDEYRFVDAEPNTGHWQFGLFCSAVRNKPSRKLYGTNKLYPEKECKTIVDFFFGWTEKRHYKRRDHPMVFPVDDVYPLTVRPYGPYMLPAPRNPENFLAAVYGKDFESKCYLKYFGGIILECEKLRSACPFVARMQLPFNGKEVKVELVVQDSNMLSLFIPKVL